MNTITQKPFYAFIHLYHSTLHLSQHCYKPFEARYAGGEEQQHQSCTIFTQQRCLHVIKFFPHSLFQPLHQLHLLQVRSKGLRIKASASSELGYIHSISTLHCNPTCFIHATHNAQDEAHSSTIQNTVSQKNKRL